MSLRGTRVWTTRDMYALTLLEFVNRFCGDTASFQLVQALKEIFFVT